MRRPVVFLIAAIAAAPVAGAGDLMRCANRVVGAGDPMVKVAELCGRPTHTEQRTIYRSGIPRRDFALDHDRSKPLDERELLIHDRSLVEVAVEVWLYNRGRSRLMRELVFHDGRLVGVEVLGHGY